MEEIRKRAAEMVLEEQLKEPDFRKVKAALLAAKRQLTPDEARQYFKDSIVRKKPWDAIEAARLFQLSEREKKELLKISWVSGGILEALKVTKRKLKPKEFHRLVSRALSNWDELDFVIRLAKRTKEALTDGEKWKFFQGVVETIRKEWEDGAKDVDRYLSFLNGWLKPLQARHIFSLYVEKETRKGWADRVFHVAMKLAKIAKGEISKEVILYQGARAICCVARKYVTIKSGLKEMAETIKEVTGERLTDADYFFIFLTAKSYGGLYTAFEVAKNHPDVIPATGLSDLIVKYATGRPNLWDCAVEVAKFAKKLNKLDPETVKFLIREIPRGEHSISDIIYVKVDLCELALEMGIDPAEVLADKTKTVEA